MINAVPPHAPSPRQFDYAGLPVSKRGQVEEQAESIRGLLGKSASNVVQIGLRLNLVRGTIGRAHFQAWLRAEFCWSQSVASNYMRAAAAFGSVECLQQFQPGALYVLARRRVSEAARRIAIDRARGGEFISKCTAEEIVSAHSRFAIRVRKLQTTRVRGLVRGLAKEVRRLPREELLAVVVALNELLSRLQRELRFNQSDDPLATG